MVISNAISTAVSGLRAGATRAAVAADNIANATTRGFIPSEVISTTVMARGGVGNPGGAGVRTSVRPAVSLSADTLDNYNVDLANEFARLIQTRTAYRASASLVRTADRMQREALDELA